MRLRNADRGLRIAEVCRLGRKALPLMTPNARAEAEALIAGMEDPAGLRVAFETDMQPVCNAIVSALNAGDIEALLGLRVMLPHLLEEVNESPALADALALQLGKSLVQGLTVKPSIRTGNAAWDDFLHPRGEHGRFAESDIKANIQRGRNAMQRVVSEETDVIAAMHRADVGDIDFLWDHKGMGVKHIIARREEQDRKRPDLNKLSVDEMMARIPEVIARGKVTPAGDTIEIEHEGIRVLLGKVAGKSSNAWMMSGYEVNPESRRKGGNR